MRGSPAANLKDEVKDCAERMGYHWAENTDPDVPCAGLMYQENVMIAVSAKKVRYGLSENCIIENKFPDDIENVRALPLPPFVIREFWVRTQNERAFRRFYVLPGDHRGDRGKYQRGVPEHPLPGGVLEEASI